MYMLASNLRKIIRNTSFCFYIGSVKIYLILPCEQVLFYSKAHCTALMT